MVVPQPRRGPETTTRGPTTVTACRCSQADIKEKLAYVALDYDAEVERARADVGAGRTLLQAARNRLAARPSCPERKEKKENHRLVTVPRTLKLLNASGQSRVTLSLRQEHLRAARWATAGGERAPETRPPNPRILSGQAVRGGKEAGGGSPLAHLDHDTLRSVCSSVRTGAARTRESVFWVDFSSLPSSYGW